MWRERFSDINIINASLGLKYRAFGHFVVTGNVLLKLDNGGLRLAPFLWLALLIASSESHAALGEIEGEAERGLGRAREWFAENRDWRDRRTWDASARATKIISASFPSSS